MHKDVKTIFLFGLSTIRGELVEDIYIDYYLDGGNGPSDFGHWGSDELSDDEFNRLVASDNKDKEVMELYRRFKNHQHTWLPEDERPPVLETVQQLSEFLTDRSSKMRRRFALEKKENGGFTLMDHWTLNPDELTEFLRPGMEQIERNEVSSSSDVLSRARERLEGMEE